MAVAYKYYNKQLSIAMEFIYLSTLSLITTIYFLIFKQHDLLEII